MPTGIETERKFVLAKGEELPDLEEVANLSRAERFRLDAVYYDTPGYRLYHGGLELRRRTGGHDPGWQLKLPTDDPDERIEVRLPMVEPRLPFELRQHIADLVELEPLLPVAELHTAREQRDLRDPTGAVLAHVFIDRVRATVVGRLQEWSEIEVELVTGDRQFLDRVERTLWRAGVPRSPVSSKFAQAVAEQATRHDQPVDTPEAGPVLMDYLGRQVGVLQALEAEVVADGFDAVHRSRVATRRIRSCLRTYSGVLRGQAVHGLAEELRWHGEQLGAPRDAEVLLHRLTAALAETTGAGRDRIAALVTSRLERRHAEAHESLVSGLSGERYWRLQAALERFMAEPPLERTAGDPASVVLPAMLAQALHRVRRRAERAAARPDDLTRWHAVRKAAKAVRYGAEVLVPVLGPAAERGAEAWAEVTTLFGEVQDAVIASQLISELWLEAEEAGLPRGPLDEVRHAQDRAVREALADGRASLTAELAAPALPHP
jgi:CHAD domain-containing protein